MKRRSFGLKADGIKDDNLYLHLESLIIKHGSYRAAVEDLLIRDKEDQLGKELSAVKEEIVQDVMKEIKNEIRSLKEYIADQLTSRTFRVQKTIMVEDLMEDDPDEEEVYDIQELDIAGEIEEEYEYDF